jgi:hypothetical protein
MIGIVNGIIFFKVGCADQAVVRMILQVFFMDTFSLTISITFLFRRLMMMVKKVKRSKRNGKNH